jgi:diguanylate cyclase (GGDEF)-like protein
MLEWQIMFNGIYGQSTQTILPESRRHEDKAHALLLAGNKLAEELGELGEALVIAPFSTAELYDELADVFAWICGAANALPVAFEEGGSLDLGDVIWTQYPDQCDRCETNPCLCTIPPIQRILEREGLTDMRGVDGLTGLYGRGRFDADLKRHSRNGVKQIGLAFFDIDDFKRFNEMPGAWRQGDLVLRTVAERAQTSAGKARVYRYGGDEFALIAINAKALEIKELIERMHVYVCGEAVPAVETRNGDAGNATVSLGAAVTNDWNGDVENLLRRAQDAAAGVKDTTKGKLAFTQLE